MGIGKKSGTRPKWEGTNEMRQALIEKMRQLSIAAENARISLELKSDELAFEYIKEVNLLIK